MKFPIFSAQIESDLETLLEGAVIGGWRRRFTGGPERRNSDGGGVPAKAIGSTNGGLLQLVFQQLADGHGSGTVLSGF